MADENLYAPPEADIAVSDPIELAGRWARLGGALIDGLIAALVIWPAMFAFGYWEKAVAGEQTIIDTVSLAALGIGVFMILNGYLLANHGQTIGKRLVKTRIVSIQDEKILSLGRVFGLRYLPIWVLGQIPLAGPIFSLVDPLFVFRGDKRCIHDLIAGTKVVTVSSN